MRKKGIFTALILSLLLVSVTPAYAAINNGTSVNNETSVNNFIVKPMFTNINYFSNNFEIDSSGFATLTSIITARNVDQATIDVYLQAYMNGQWTTVNTWSATQYGMSATLGESQYVSSGYQYRMVSYGYVYSNGYLVESTSYISGSQVY